MSKKTQNWAVPLIAVLLGMLVGAVLMLIFGYDPFWAYYDLFSTAFGSLKNIGEILRAMSPLILIALGFSVASKAGLFNVGLPGQALAGWTSAVWFALAFPELPKVVSIVCTVIIGLVAGGITGAVPGILRAYLGTSEVIVTIMMNYIILYVANNIVRFGFTADMLRSSEASNRVSAFILPLLRGVFCVWLRREVGNQVFYVLQRRSWLQHAPSYGCERYSQHVL